ncbi:MAG TPA: ribonuclease HII [Dissulfurispiraceae bacterium]|nr:ribonuclease HII [Dissulfurispiraceae bacterium]
MDPYEYDESAGNGEFSIIAGVDEAGRGPLAGPVVAAAVVLNRNQRISGVRDSKKVPEAEREELYRMILSSGRVGVGVIDADEIDRINILNATKKAMYIAVSDLGTNPELILIDALTIPGVGVRQIPIIKGDAKSASIAAASIIAKVTRDRIMMEYHAAFPQYGFDSHKGYATREHLECLRLHGPCPIHRKSFHPVMSQQLPFMS